ncbi:MAG: hypothetical protein SPJ13_08100 [Bacteroidales bacterium]|nr:hypothetical protein [Bacteroidales bacterium]
MNKRQIAFSVAALLSVVLVVASTAACLAMMQRSPRPVGAKDYLLLGAVFTIACGLLCLVAVGHKDSPLHRLVAGTRFERLLRTMGTSYGPARQNGKLKLFVPRKRQSDPHGRRLTESALAMLAIAFMAVLVEKELFFGLLGKWKGINTLFTVVAPFFAVLFLPIEALLFLDNKKGRRKQ